MVLVASWNISYRIRQLILWNLMSKPGRSMELFLSSDKKSSSIQTQILKLQSSLKKVTSMFQQDAMEKVQLSAGFTWLFTVAGNLKKVSVRPSSLRLVTFTGLLPTTSSCCSHRWPKQILLQLLNMKSAGILMVIKLSWPRAGFRQLVSRKWSIDFNLLQRASIWMICNKMFSLLIEQRNW